MSGDGHRCGRETCDGCRACGGRNGCPACGAPGRVPCPFPVPPGFGPCVKERGHSGLHDFPSPEFTFQQVTTAIAEADHNGYARGRSEALLEAMGLAERRGANATAKHLRQLYDEYQAARNAR